MPDLTILYITANAMPPAWTEFQLHYLLEAASGFPIISLSRRPMSLGRNVLDTGQKSYWNIYHQMLVGARLADTPYVAVAEDDTLYTPEHFREFRPPVDTVAFDMSWWSLLTWHPECYSIRPHRVNATFIGPRDLVIAAIEEREAKHPEGLPDRQVGEIGRAIAERRMGVTQHASVVWYCSNPIVRLDHPTGTDNGNHGRSPNGKRLVKRPKQFKAEVIPYWGTSEEIVRIYESGSDRRLLHWAERAAGV